MKAFTSKKNLYLLALLVVTLIGLIVTPTYAKFMKDYTTTSDVAGVSLAFDIGITNIEEYEVITVPANSHDEFNISVTNSTENTLYYGVWYRMVEPTEKSSDITIARIKGTTATTSGELASNASTTPSIVVINDSDTEITLNIGVASSTTSVGDIEYIAGKKLVRGNADIPSLVNKPNLDNGNLIPVYYDETVGVEAWKKADSYNKNNSWYNYENKMWANAIIVNPDKLSDYQTTNVGTVIDEDDIIAFYVWIPRYKYRVWNIMRQGGEESTYAYPAFSNGIEIEFEIGTDSTGNIECSYDVTNTTPETVLSDHCTYNKNDEILLNETDDEGNAITNLDYTDAWYTHPAFTFGNKKIEGFWIGKFETSGTADETTNIADNPTILPDVISLRNQNISQQFTTSKVFQNYLSNEVDAHMLTNLEWGAVSYLTHSIYGMCDGNTCDGVKYNNSSGVYTGRSGGNIAGNIDTLATRYGDTTDTSSNTYNEFGYYDYKGYSLSSAGTPTTKEDNKIASTTDNITGVYDMSGGAYEYVMGNMVTEDTFLFNPGAAVLDDATNPWNGLEAISLYYYNAYSYSTFYSGLSAYNRSRLGDAQAEILGKNNYLGAWLPGNMIDGSYSGFVAYANELDMRWVSRGGCYNSSFGSEFGFGGMYGSGFSTYTFRSSIS